MKIQSRQKKTWDENVTDLPLLQDRELWQDLAPPDKQLTIFNLLKLIMSVMLKMSKISLEITWWTASPAQ